METADEAAHLDWWRAREGVAHTLAALAPSVGARDQLPVVFAFLKRALADDDEAVAGEMVAAGRELIEKQPDTPAMVLMLVPMLESFLAEPAKTATDDRVRQGVVLYFGSLAKHIPADDAKVAQVRPLLSSAHPLRATASPPPSPPRDEMAPHAP